MPQSHVLFNNYQELELLHEYKKIQELGYHFSFLNLEGRANKKFQLQKILRKQKISRTIRNEKIQNLSGKEVLL